MSHSTAFIASILKIRLGLDSEDFKLDYDTIKIHFAPSLITNSFNGNIEPIVMEIAFLKLFVHIM